MKVVIAGGTSQAEFIISMFKGKKNELIVINPDDRVADTLVKRCRVPVYKGQPWRKFVLEEAGAYDADIFISLCEEDTDNYASCILAKRVFAAKKTICVVNNPKNVDLYKRLGLDSIISSTYLLAQSIRGESSLTSVIKTLSLDNDKLNVVEAVILSKYAICFRKIKDIAFPRYASIAAIYRNYRIIIPSGMVELQPKDTLLMVTAPENIQKLLAYVQEERGGGRAAITKMVETNLRKTEQNGNPDEVPDEPKPAEKPAEPEAPKTPVKAKEKMSARKTIAKAKKATVAAAKKVVRTAKKEKK